jgi:hypothetical protein
MGHPRLDRNDADRTEATMMRQLAICGALFVGAIFPAEAQQREAMLQRVEIPGAPFDLVIAAPKPEGVTYDLAETPDALLLNLAGGELAIGFERVETMLKALALVQAPVHAFGGNGRTPIAIYAVPKSE